MHKKHPRKEKFDSNIKLKVKTRVLGSGENSNIMSPKSGNKTASKLNPRNQDIKFRA